MTVSVDTAVEGAIQSVSWQTQKSLTSAAHSVNHSGIKAFLTSQNRGVRCSSLKVSLMILWRKKLTACNTNTLADVYL